MRRAGSERRTALRSLFLYVFYVVFFAIKFSFSFGREQRGSFSLFAGFASHQLLLSPREKKTMPPLDSPLSTLRAAPVHCALLPPPQRRTRGVFTFLAERPNAAATVVAAAASSSPSSESPLPGAPGARTHEAASERQQLFNEIAPVYDVVRFEEKTFKKTAILDIVLFYCSAQFGDLDSLSLSKTNKNSSFASTAQRRPLPGAPPRLEAHGRPLERLP